jgi:hypothetical protein
MWKVLLTTGISIFLFFSCEKDHEGSATKTDYKFKNTTTQNVELIVQEKMTLDIQTFLLEPNQEKTFSKPCLDGAGNGICEWFTSGNNITFKFISDNKCLVNYSKVYKEYLYDNFSTDMYNNSENTLLYLIDAEEVAAATVCN